jgi:hypothetical protein
LPDSPRKLLSVTIFLDEAAVGDLVLKLVVSSIPIVRAFDNNESFGSQSPPVNEGVGEIPLFIEGLNVIGLEITSSFSSR